MSATDQLVQATDGPWTHMIDSLVPTTRVEGAYQYGQNVYPADSEMGEALVGRPGSRPLGAGILAPVRGIAEFTNGSLTWRVAAAGGELYTLNWATEVWTKVITTAQLTLAGITFEEPGASSSNSYALVPAFDQLFVSDGNHTPFLWDGTTGGGLTLLANCPPLYGTPTVHQARLFGIKNLDRRTMVWSEPDDPTTGYEAGGFANAWTFRQTDPHALTRLVGTNQGLVVFRARSVTLAVGDVGTLEFQSADTREAIDEAIGTNTPHAVVEIGRNIVFLDTDLRPQLIRPGATGVIPLWQGFRNTLDEGSGRALPDMCFGLHYTSTNLILFLVPGVGLLSQVMLVLSANTETPKPVGVWTGWTEQTGDSIYAFASLNRSPIPTSGGAVDTGAGQPMLVHGTRDGYVYLHGRPDDATFLTDDQTPLGTQPITHLVYGQALGFSVKREKIWDRIDASIRVDTAQTVTMWTRSPRGDTDPFPVSVEPSDTSIESHAALGIDVQSRWIAPRIAHQAVGEQFGLVGMTITGYASDDDPEAP